MSSKYEERNKASKEIQALSNKKEQLKREGKNLSPEETSRLSQLWSTFKGFAFKETERN